MMRPAVGDVSPDFLSFFIAAGTLETRNDYRLFRGSILSPSKAKGGDYESEKEEGSE